MLHRKWIRDMRHSAMQFVSIALLCALGTFLFAGLDGIANLAQGTIDVYFEENHLADFWVTTPCADRETLVKLRSIPGIADVCARADVKLETTLPDGPKLMVTAYAGAMTINRPIVQTGSQLATDDVRGCLMQAGFASAHGLTVGDRVAVKLGGEEYGFVIRGTVFSPEYICVTEGTYPNPQAYGYILINAAAMPALPLCEVLVELSPNTKQEEVRTAIRQAIPGALILDRAAHQSTSSAVGNAEMFRKLLYVFPIMAYAVSALIAMTTLTRMMDQQRLQIGTLKALGYPSQSICMHYLAYAFWPSLVGALAGVAVGHLTLPRLIWALLLGQNEYPYQIYPKVSVASWGMAALSVMMSLFICWYAYQNLGKETTAQLLRPKAPKAGKRILLERITPIWRRLGFNGKIILRSIIRNRMRTLLSFVGILSCNALIIASFGMQDSVKALAVDHFQKTLSYDLRANVTDAQVPPEAYRGRLGAQRVECVMETAVSVHSARGERTTLLTVTENGQTLLHLGRDNTPMELMSGGLIMTEKLAKTLHTGVGEAVELRLPGEKEPVLLPICQLACNNVQQGVYMTRSTWEALRRGAFTPTAILIQAPGPNDWHTLKIMDEVDTIDQPVEQSRELTNTLELVSSVFVILMCLALALAFVICYNMGLMNFAEREREYATLKVLGYHQWEIRGLIVGENNVISLLAVLCSVYPGLQLTSLVLMVCQTDAICYPSRPTVLAVAGACLITYAFSLLIQLFLVRKVKRIDMVEALKSVE